MFKQAKFTLEPGDPIFIDVSPYTKCDIQTNGVGTDQELKVFFSLLSQSEAVTENAWIQRLWDGANVFVAKDDLIEENAVTCKKTLKLEFIEGVGGDGSSVDVYVNLANVIY